MWHLYFVLVLSSFTSVMQAEALQCSGGKTHSVHLTFDDGPSEVETVKVLDALDSHDPPLKATFFVSTNKLDFVRTKPKSSWSRRERALIAVVERIKASGHTLGNHTFDHIHHGDSDNYTSSQVQNNIAKSHAVWTTLGLPIPAPLRFPYGGGWFVESDPENETLRRNAMGYIAEKGYYPVHWDIDSWDWSKHKRKAIPDSILEQICTHGGGNVLFHDIQPYTAENIGSIISSIEEAGHQIVSSSEIKTISESRARPFHSFRDSVVGIFYCDQSVSDIDQVWGDCDEYIEKSINHGGSDATR